MFVIKYPVYSKYLPKIYYLKDTYKHFNKTIEISNNNSLYRAYLFYSTARIVTLSEFKDAIYEGLKTHILDI